MITGQKKGEFSVTLSNGQHQIIADIAKEIGGTDEGLNPHELVEAALTACTLLTLHLYAKRKNWDSSQVKVEVKIIQEGPESIIRRKIDFGSLPDDQASRMREIANKCPIHKLLESNVKIENL
jgi:putative redox protein